MVACHCACARNHIIKALFQHQPIGPFALHMSIRGMVGSDQLEGPANVPEKERGDL